MENASKALIMAGGMLIGIIIISIGVYLLAVYGGTSKNIQDQLDARVLAEFNNNFLKYQGSDKCTIHDIVSLASFAKKNNQDLGLADTDKNNDYYVSVYITKIKDSYNKKNLSSSTIGEDDYIELIDSNSVKNTIDSEGKTIAETQYFTCTNIEFRTIGEQKRVKSITFNINN